MLKWLPVLALLGCGFVDYPKAPVGRFDGALLVMWVGEGDGTLGDGRFVFVPAETPLTFTRTLPDGRAQVIQPEMMYTDGGSIPALAQAFHGFSPWGYAPAYMVHDWLFAAHKCLNDGLATPAEQAVAGVSFQDSAQIAAEAIKTLIAAGKVAPNDVAPEVISNTVARPVTRQYWNAKGACEHVSDADAAMVHRALNRSMGFRQAGPAATILQVIEF
jgi:hypothetical protein